MAELNAAEKEAKAEAAFGMAFNDAPPAEIPPAKVVEEPKPVAPKPVAAAPAVAPPKPEYIRPIKQDWDNLKAAAGKISTLESQVAKLTGSIPKAEQIIQQAVDKMRSQTPAGVSVEFSDEDFAELAADFPDIAKSTRASLEKIFKKANVRGGGDAKPIALDESAVAKVLDTILAGREKQAFEEAHPAWKDIVGAVDVKAGEKPPENNSFRQWLAAQPPEYQKKISDTQSFAVVHSAVDRFLASQKAVATITPPARPDRAAARRAVIEDAVTPRADGNPPPAAPRVSAEEAFGNAFKARKRH